MRTARSPERWAREGAGRGDGRVTPALLRTVAEAVTASAGNDGPPPPPEIRTALRTAVSRHGR
ncbi:hypothetical protein J7I94_26030 [Streptomyces sp. ISL-12]|uniref:hypothetical protein n=1 Tax=Streptomyces sp. ISL-12 TaxID=2819177 RepID=UPI001BED11DC|nr:hypothetical protein [Streptomyces sp. ISL-12]MBT2413962.1 hypothetical protein [Streptomyces sp. ISL-12]